jgi:hypothetical protein
MIAIIVLFKYNSKLFKSKSQIPIFPGHYYTSVTRQILSTSTYEYLDLYNVYTVFPVEFLICWLNFLVY